jgi:hypothetical protein
LIAVNNREPAFREAYSRGDLGVVKPRFYPRYLLQAYRVFNGRAAVRGGALRPWEGRGPVLSKLPGEDWAALVEKLQGPLTREQFFQLMSASRSLANFQSFDNCLDDAFAHAARTLGARTESYGASSREVREWLRGQLAVFQNCSGSELVLPDAAPAWADDLLQADRRYQLASAYFYGLQFDEAARRFHTIAEDRNSPWRPYGRYLAARAAIRRVTVPEDGAQHATESYSGGGNRSQSRSRGSIGPFAAGLRARPSRLRSGADPTRRPVPRVVACASRTIAHRQTRRSSITSRSEEAFSDGRLPSRCPALGSTGPHDARRPQRLGIGDDGRRSGVGRAGDRAMAAATSLHWLVAALWNVPASHPGDTGSVERGERRRA